MSDLLYAAIITIGVILLGSGAGWFIVEIVWAFRSNRRRLRVAHLITPAPHTTCSCCQIPLDLIGGIDMPTGVSISFLPNVGGYLIETTVCADCYLERVAA